MASTSVHPIDFEPSLVAYRTYASRRLTRIDTAVLLSGMLCLLYLLPGRFIVPNLTYAGRPALLVALLFWCWWLLARLNPWLVVVGPQPMRWAVLAFFLWLLLCYLVGTMRGLPSLEANAQNFGVLAVVEFLGVILVAADGIPNMERLKGVLRVFLWCAAFSAICGIYSSITKVDIATFYRVPFLELKGGTVGFENRGVGFRVAGTATHYIEFSACMAMAVPFGIHFTRFAQKKIHRRLALLATLVCAAAVPIAISRTGVVALLAGLLVMIPIWGWRFRYNMLLVAVVLGGALMVLKPGLLGTIRGMFAGASEDPSIEGRTKDYALVAHWFSERPWLGRGPWTLVPELYQGLVLDNQWLYTLVTGGLVGVAVLAALHITSITLAALALRRSEDPETRHLCTALIAIQVICILVEGTVDSFYYTTFSTTMALLMGVCGAMWRFTHPARTVRTSSVRRWITSDRRTTVVSSADRRRSRHAAARSKTTHGG